MKILELQEAVIDWPAHLPIPVVGDGIDAGKLGIAVVSETMMVNSGPKNPTIRRVKISIRPSIQ